MRYWNINNNEKIYEIIFIRKIYLFFYFFVLINISKAQYNTFSLFSRYGIGDIQENVSAYQKAMNNSGMAFPVDTTAPVFINISNPASLSQLRLTVLEGSGEYYHTRIINQQNYKVQNQSVNFNSLIIGFPIKKYSGFCFGIMPYSSVGYNINQDVSINNIGMVNYVYDGSGGLNKVLTSYGFSLSKYFTKKDSIYRPMRELIKNLSIGANLNYVFGEIAQTVTVNYPDNTSYYNFVNDKRTLINGISANIGLQSFLNLSKQKNSILGIAFVSSVPSKLRASNDYLSYNFSYTYYGNKYITDTIQYIEDEASKMNLPHTYAAGISYIVLNKWGIGLDLKYTDWKRFNLLNHNNNLKNSIEVNTGAYYQPDRFATGKTRYFSKVIYRIGLGYNAGYQEYQGRNIPAYSFSAGASFPMGLYRAFSAMHISAQYIIKGQKDFILRENIFKLNIGIIFNERWFIKYKYD